MKLSYKLIPGIDSNYGYSIYRIFFDPDRGYRQTFLVHEGSFGNCQNYTINSFCKFIAYAQSSEQLSELIKFLRPLMNGRKMIVCDLQESIFFKLKNWLEELKINYSSLPYTSTNNSSMVLCVIDTSNIV